MRQVWRNERGMALAVAIFALVVVGALVAGALFLGTQEQRVGENQYRLGQSFGIAEAVAPEFMRQWNTDSFNARRFYPTDTVKLGNRSYGARGWYTGYVFKLNRNLYLFDLTGSDTTTRSGSLAFRRRGGGGRSRLGILARIRPLQIPAHASLTTQGNVTLSGNAAVDGTDQIPNPSWTTCAPPDTTKAGIRMAPTGTVNTSGNAYVEGDPPVLKDPTVADSTFNVFGDVTYADLANRANIRFVGSQNLSTAPVTTPTGQCDRTVKTNWGDGLNRAGACGNYFPIIHIAGDVTLNNVQGQGVLLVDGDLWVQGSYEFFGVVIVKGRLRTSGGGTSVAHFWGAVMAQNVDIELNNISGNATLNYSKCAIIQALEWTGLGAMMRSRSFMALN
ncbi:MAG TPA: pilus assembly PilX N-terminal domain-containing protein [Gemmatimonadales bacterium]|nr:pilus assembly PilX N-terminal domain-containing protein [Gemmatimonadales bacterium]